MYAKIPLDNIKKIQIVQTDCKKTVAQVKKSTGAQYVLNGGLYNMATRKPLCKLRVDGVTYADDQYGYWSYAWNTGGDIAMIHSDQLPQYRNGIACVSMLKDGQNTLMNYNSDMGGSRQRSAIGLDGAGNLVLYCDKTGKTMEQLREIMRGYGCASAISLDGGASSSGDFHGQTVTTTRKVANYICVFVKEDVTKCQYTEPTELIQSGSRGDGAKWVQWMLNASMNSGLSVDGIFGAKSVSALKTFQSKYSLAVDGICGVNTRNQLKEVVYG